MIRRLVLLCTTSTLALSPATAQMQRGLEEIVVTARRQAENLQNTPVAVTAITAADIEGANILESTDIARITPSLTVSQTPSYISAASFVIRGIGETNPSMGLDTGVGIYVDGIYVARSAGALFDLVDPERVEILRGPQGTLFGRNTTGGAVQIITKRPAEKLGLIIRGGYGSRNEWFVKGRFDTGTMGGSPIAAAFTFQHRQKNGYFDNHYTPASHDPGSLNANSFRAQLRGDFEDLTVDYSFDYDKRKGAPPFFQIVAASPDVRKYYGNSVNLGGNPFQIMEQGRLRSGWMDPSPAAVTPPGADPFRAVAESWGHNLTIAYDVSENVSLKSITGYRGIDINIPHGDAGNGGLLGVILDPVTFAPSIDSVTTYHGYDGPQQQKQFSEELQLSVDTGELNLVAGLYYFWEQSRENNMQAINFVLPGGDASLRLDPVIAYEVRSQSYAAFAQASYKPDALDNRLELTGGVRYTRDKKKIELRHRENGALNIIGDRNGQASFSNVSFMGSLSYRFTPNVMAYAKVATGYKSGGFNPQINQLNKFDPEKLISAEAGIKSDLFDQHARVNLAAFWSRYKDLQISQFAPGTGGATGLIVNAGRATFKGIEGELTIMPLDRLTITGTFGYTDMKYDEFLFRDPATDLLYNIADQAHFLGAARFNSSLSLSYSLPAFSWGRPNTYLSWAHRSSVTYHPYDLTAPFNRAVMSPRQDTLSARIALSDIPFGGRTQGEIALIGENLLDQDQVNWGIDFGALGFAGVVYGEPRRFGVQLTVKY